MRRLRVALVMLLVALAVPVALLVMRALESARLEERVRHEAVASRIFDEMERTLSDFLAREEARAPDDYRFYRWPADDPRARPGVRERSPLSRRSVEPFVIAHFQIQPDGRLRTPLRPVDEAAAERAGDWPPPDDVRDATLLAVETLEREVVPFWREAEKRRWALATDAAAEPSASGTGSEVDEAKTEQNAPKSLAKAMRAAPNPSPPALRATAPATPESPGDDRQDTAYALIESLNVGARKRADRRQQVKQAPREARQRLLADEVQEFEDDDALGALGFSTRAADAAGAMRQEGIASSPDTEEEAYGANPGRASQSVAPSAAPVLREPPASTRPGGAFLADPVRIVLEPMVGHPLGEGYLMLYRTVLVDGEGFRQGLLLDRTALGAWLSREVIGLGSIAQLASVRFDGAGSTGSEAAGYRALHRFAEPFAGLTAELHVGPLEGSSSTTTILMLSGGLVVVALLGVFAVHRMASVVVEFAERRSNFVAAVSHELKTPLTAIRMHGEMLRDGLVPSDEKRVEYYRTITDESERLSRLIDNVLEFSRLEKGQRSLSSSVGSPGPVVADIVERLRPHAEREGFSLTAEIAEATPAVRFDRDALAQMVFNLVDNAIKYAAASARKEITVCCEASEDGGAAVSVRDFGPGVPREQLARIFEPFHRVEAEITRTTKGSGIGLSLVKQLGDAMGAAVTGECPVGGGFRVCIAFAPSPA